jgi:methylated-DNA-[protein]-cysteine S-methyltransferase
MTLAYRTIESPVGTLKLVASDKGLAAVLWENEDPKRVRLGEVVRQDTHPILSKAARQLEEYSAGERRTFSLPLDMRGTPFQRSVWEALLDISFGETKSYGELASQLGKAQAARAVGAASGRNPISIIVPCHRLVGATGKLTGFAGGLQAKARLLSLEQGTIAEHGTAGSATQRHTRAQRLRCGALTFS